MNPSRYTTRVLPLADPAAQQEAVALLAQEEIFAAPTDTVYGIFCRPDSPTAIARVYLAKARPPDKAIPVLIGDMAQLELVVQLVQMARSPWLPIADQLMANFWPGALTLVLPAEPYLPPILTAGQPTVAVRMPAHAALCALLRQTGPLAATSANRSSGPDTHTAAEVLAQLDGSIPLILQDDAPAVHASLSSTVVDLTHPTGPRILRAGQLHDAVSRLLDEFRGAQGR
ncbi:MAG: threonylcarbamoyl-AMP synthase [Caldilineaceae bacterium]|nr:threonylcarbamoyl-AMP synthase [Caldilineaceae bacterium]